jgi:large subunit ribosomal protein L4
MEVPIYDITGNSVGTRDLDETVFGIEPNIPVMHQAHLRQLANARLGTHDTKTRGEVRGGGRKPWRQKGTGRARQGSIRSPQWRTGGVVWGPHPRSYRQQMNKKARRLAIRSVLSAKVQDEQVIVIDGLSGIDSRTKTMKSLLATLPASQRSTLVVIGPEGDWRSVYRAGSNLPEVKIIRAGYVNVHDVLKYERLILSTEAVDTIESLWAVSK